MNRHKRTAGQILNQISGAVAGYSLDKLRNGEDKAIIVRRSSDDTELDIGFVAGSLDTASLLAFCGAGSGFVARWYDQSGNGNHATQAVLADQPRIVNAGVVDVDSNGKPLLHFDGTTFLTGSVITSDNNMAELSGVINPNRLDNGRNDCPFFMGLLSTPANHFGGNGFTGIFSSFYTSARVLLYDIAGNNVKTIYTLINNGSSLTLRYNGVSQPPLAITFAQPDTFRIGRSGILFTPHFVGDIQEHILFTSNLSEAQRTRLYDNQKGRYGIT